MRVNIHSIAPQFNYSFNTTDVGIVGVYGISGSGKSSLLDALAGYQNNLKGSIKFNNSYLFNTEAKQFSHVIKCSYMRQHPILFPHWTINENLNFALEHSNSKININNLLDKLDCKQLSNKYPKQLSGGEKQRIAFIRSLILIKNNGLVLLDEPFSALDKKNRLVAIELLNHYKKKCLIYLVTHKISEIYEIADELLCIKSGTISYHDTISLAMSSGRNQLPIASRITLENKPQIIYADDVSISLQHNPHSSIVHQLDVYISAINIINDVAILQLKTDTQRLYAKITKQSLQKLNLTNNIKVVANFKATSYGK